MVPVTYCRGNNVDEANQYWCLKWSGWKERNGETCINHPCLYFNQANVTPQTRKQKSHSIINHCDEYQAAVINNTVSFLFSKGELS